MQQSVDLLSEKIHLADWSLEPDLLLDAQMARDLAAFTNPLSAGELYEGSVHLPHAWPNPFDPETTVVTTRAGHASMQLSKDLSLIHI